LRIGLLGGSGLVGRDLIDSAPFFGFEVVIFSRDPQGLEGYRTYKDLKDSTDLDALLNLVGGHRSPNTSQSSMAILEIDLAATAWSKRFDRPYIYMSSGAVFPKSSFPVTVQSPTMNSDGLSSYENLKAHIEDQHSRANKSGSNVTDLRLFSFTGEQMIERGDYLLSNIFAAGLNRSSFQLTGSSFLRDYVGASEVWQAIRGILSIGGIRRFNLFSGEPITRHEVASIFEESFPDWEGLSNCSAKEMQTLYYSNRDSQIPDYTPRSSARAIRDTVRALIHKKKPEA
jgi:nucleoside-diphosphate-sugar epimerase